MPRASSTTTRMSPRTIRTERRAELRYTNAQINLNKLTGNYNWYTGQPSEIDVALTQANLDAAVAAVKEAEWYAATLRGEPIPPEGLGDDAGGAAKRQGHRRGRGDTAAGDSDRVAVRRRCRRAWMSGRENSPRPGKR